MTNDQMKLQEYLNKMAQKSKDSGDAFSVTTEIEHWASYDIYSIEQFEHYDAQATHYDFYKEINGIRPRWMNYDKMTTADIEAEIHLLILEQQENEVLEREERNEYSRMVQKRKANNAYQPNLAFSGLKGLLAA